MGNWYSVLYVLRFKIDVTKFLQVILQPFFFFFFLFVIILFSWTIIITFIVNSRALNRRVRASTIYRRVLLEISRILHLLIKRIIKVCSQGWLIFAIGQIRNKLRNKRVKEKYLWLTRNCTMDILCPFSPTRENFYTRVSKKSSWGRNCCWATEEYSMSIGFVLSRRAGASQRMMNVPTIDAIVKIHRKSLSRTIATKPQSWSSALNSSCRCMWCWMNITLCKAFSSSKGYFFLGVTSLRDSSSPDITVGSPLYPPIPPKNLLCAVVVCSPLHPPIRWWRAESGDETMEDDCTAAATAALNLLFFPDLPLPCILCAARSFNRSSGTLIRRSFGNLLMKIFLTQGAILWVLGFR